MRNKVIKKNDLVMSKTWYLVIDYVKCAECGTCFNIFQNGVYDKEKALTPVVIYPEEMH
jgi:dissimilatory sulfite reductase (desulfoviridin) alpha/beta subunit